MHRWTGPRSSRTVVAGVLLAVSPGCGDGTGIRLGDIPDSVSTGSGSDASLGDAAGDLSALDARDAARDTSDASDVDVTEAAADAAREIQPSCGDAATAGSVAAPLLAQLVGFGAAATGGGASGCLYHVTSLADAGPGTLRDAMASDQPLWIVFDVSGDLQLQADIPIPSNKTIDGRGAQVTIHDYGLVVTGPASNVIIENLSFTSVLTTANNDAIRLIDGAHTVWIDHCTFSGYADGLVDVTRAATDVTVSWCSFGNHDKVLLIGSSVMDTGDVDIRVTLHHNWWNQTGNYTPRLRFGQVHMFNNVADLWKSAAAVVTMGGQIYSEANVYNEATHPVAIFTTYSDDPTGGNAVSVGDLLQNGAMVQTTAPSTVFVPSVLYRYVADPADATLYPAVTSGAGRQP